MIRIPLLFAMHLATPLLATPAFADEARVVGVEVERVGDGRYRFSVTLAHPDTGWDHYANAWHVESPNGERFGTRTLAHPHVDEQPFTRSATIDVPAGTTHVTVRAEDSVHGLSTAVHKVELPTQ